MNFPLRHGKKLVKKQIEAIVMNIKAFLCNEIGERL